MNNKNIWIAALVIVVMALVGFGVYQYGNSRTTSSVAPMMKDMPMHDHEGMMGKDHPHVATKYGCPMHPEVMSPKPGKCSVCGMEMIKK